MNCNVVGDFSINRKISFIQNKINHFQLVRSYSYYEWQLLRKINIGPALLETKLENAKSNNSLVSTAISFHCYSLWWGICSIFVSYYTKSLDFELRVKCFYQTSHQTCRYFHTQNFIPIGPVIQKLWPKSLSVNQQNFLVITF